MNPSDWATLCVRLVPTWETLLTKIWLCLALYLYRHQSDMFMGSDRGLDCSPGLPGYIQGGGQNIHSTTQEVGAFS